MTAHLEQDRREIAARVRALRTGRGLTQAALARLLGLSQNRLSEIERGAGSFSAEQFLRILRVFNVGASTFVSGGHDRGLEVQNALARLGAAHLHESPDVLVSDELARAHDAVREALLIAEPRLVTAIAPVLVAQAGRLNLARLYADLEALGRERRVAWVVDNTRRALDTLAGEARHGPWAKLRRRVDVPFQLFLEFAEASRRAGAPALPDVLDPAIRSRRTFDDLQRDASAPSSRWSVVTSLQVEDFTRALEASLVAA